MESCFSEVVAGLHGCRLIKTEDTGDVIYDDDEIELPDYRLILKDGRQIFVEVKNCNQPNPKASYFLTNNYVEKLQRYSEINQIPLFCNILS
ncbi:hypothetical protein J4727_00480 [Providencia rettgeri]|uniref:Uncharacterized protein n=1 Tax=Providencia rettgeri TaxID=587 RepID=A0A939N9V5_PRORE|nr:hypothetical protein [Providencia rettgeri]